MKKWLDETLIFPSLKAYIDKLSEGLNIPPVMVIQNLLIRRLAEESARADVYGATTGLLVEFGGKDGELITGQELYQMIYKMEKNRLEKEYCERLTAAPWEALQEREQELMKGRGLDPESKKKRQEEEKLLQELEAEIGPVEIVLGDPGEK